jgi:hypothetical protein
LGGKKSYSEDKEPLRILIYGRLFRINDGDRMSKKEIAIIGAGIGSFSAGWM